MRRSILVTFVPVNRRFERPTLGCGHSKSLGNWRIPPLAFYDRRIEAVRHYADQADWGELSGVWNTGCTAATILGMRTTGGGSSCM